MARITKLFNMAQAGEVPVIRRVEVRYVLAGAREEDREKIERAHAVLHRGCAVSRSLEAAIDITSTVRLSSRAPGSGDRLASPRLTWRSA